MSGSDSTDSRGCSRITRLHSLATAIASLGEQLLQSISRICLPLCATNRTRSISTPAFCEMVYTPPSLPSRGVALTVYLRVERGIRSLFFNPAISQRDNRQIDCL